MIKKILLFISVLFCFVSNAQIAPVVIPDPQNTAEDIPVEICPAISDADDAISSLVTGILNVSLNGTVVPGSVTNCFTYTPNFNFSGTDSVCTYVCDPSGACDTTCSVISIIAVNDTPTISQPPVVLPEDTPIVICPLVNDMDDVNAALVISLTSFPSNGTMAPLVGQPQCFEYTPNPNFSGTDTVCFTVCDGNNACSSVCVDIFVVPLNDPPVAIDDFETTDQNVSVTIVVLANDYDIDTTLNPVSIFVVVPTNNGTLVSDPLTGDFTYTPNLNFFGADTFTYVVCDFGMPILCDTADVFINVVQVINIAPVAVNDTATTSLNTAITFPVSFNDTDVNSGIVNSSVDLDILSPGNQTIITTLNGGYISDGLGNITYTPNLGFFGTDSTQYVICDNGFPTLCDTAWIYINVQGVNTAPIANNDSIISGNNTGGSVSILMNDTDDSPLNSLNTSVGIVNNSTNGTESISISGSSYIATYTPNLNYSGLDSFTYFVCDAEPLCDTAIVYVNTLANQSPIAENDSVLLSSGDTVNVMFELNDSDELFLNNANASVSILNNANNGIVNANNFQITYASDSIYVGLDSFTYVLCDLGSLCDTATVYLEILATPIPLAISSSFINPNVCSYNCDNNIIINASGGVAPYTYSINGFAYSSSNIFNNRCPGTYVVFVKDALNNIVQETLVINYQGFGLYHYSYTPTCNSTANSYININVNGGVGPFSYQWNTGFGNSQVLNPSEGIYHVIVTDSTTGCTRSRSINFIENGCFNISGNIYADVNSNCLVDSNDIDVFYSRVKLTNTLNNVVRYKYTNYNGSYNFNVPAGTYEIELLLYGYIAGIYDVVCPISPIYSSVDFTNVSDTVDFYLEPVNNIDLRTNYWLGWIRPGFSFHNQIWYFNDGSNTMTGSVVLEYDSLLTPSIPNTAVVDVINRTMTWSFTNLTHGSAVTIFPEFDSLDVSIPLGTQICNTVTINPVSGDAIPTNNIVNSCRFVVGSYDPNQKLVYPEGDILETQKTHDYHIDFQNLGTFEATFVVVRDDLDDNLDLSTLRNVSASHNFVLTVENDDELVFTFDNIHLAAEQDDEPGSKGHIDFTIDQKENLPIGTEIENTADIYFDFNEAIITNTIKNTIVIPFGINDLSEGSIKLFPNPTQALVNVESEFKINSIEVYNVIGERVFESSNMNSSSALLNLEKLSKGIYNIKIDTEYGTMNRKIMIHSSK